MINILVRTSNRPMFFHDCIRSIKAQTYTDYRIIVGSDSNDCYCWPFNPVHYTQTKSNGRYLNLSRGIKTLHFPVNLYLNRLMDEVKEGWVMFLDDDDMMATHETLEEIAKLLTSEDTAVFWKVQLGERIIPSKQGRPKVRDFSMIGMCFHSKYIPLLQFDQYKQTDYRVADRIYSILNVKFIDKVLTRTQLTGDEFKQRSDKDHLFNNV